MELTTNTKEWYRKKRLLYGGAILIVIVLGLCSRKFTALLPDFIVEHAGDTLWSAMIYLTVRLCFMSKSLNFALLTSFLFCYVIEYSQLYQAPWINNIRETLIGALVLGHGFLLIDLFRYACGIIGTYLIEKYCFNLTT
jgi:hypothetical protein